MALVFIGHSPGAAAVAAKATAEATAGAAAVEAAAVPALTAAFATVVTSAAMKICYSCKIFVATSYFKERIDGTPVVSVVILMTGYKIYL